MIKIITDSSTLYTPSDAQKMGMESLPLCVTIGSLEGRDLLMDMNDFYSRIEQGEIPMTSQPPIGDVIDAYEKYIDCDIINITIADGLSGTYQSACSAKEMVDNAERITVFNTKTLCGPHRYMVDKVLEMNNNGKSKEEILDWLEKVSEKTESFLLPQDFAFLKRGGRLTPMAATLGSVLKLKPVMILTKDGKKIDKHAIKRTISSAINCVIEHMKKQNIDDKYVLYISHADNIKDANTAKELIQTAFPDLEIHILELSPAFATQGGPKCIAIQYIEKYN